MDLRNLFVFDRSQKRGALILLGILLAIAGGRWAWITTNNTGEEALNQLPPGEERKYEKKSKRPRTASRTYSPKAKKDRKSSRPIPPLAINEADSAEWTSMPGIGPVLSRRIVRFRAAKGGFSSVDELYNVYGLDSSVVDRIRPALSVGTYQVPDTSPLVLENTEKPQQEKADREVYTKKEPPAAPVDLNAADSAQLVQIPGIGAKTATRILKVKKLLGFYAEVSQLRLVYGISEENFQRMQPHLQVGDLSSYKKYDLNKTKTRYLSRLPFMEKPLAEAIVSKRKSLGWFESWEQLSEVSGITPDIIRQLQYYYYL
ncbi:MAG: helix-hairpin-helix domain-containing protein [Bacteroidota bacterium]